MTRLLLMPLTLMAMLLLTVSTADLQNCDLAGDMNGDGVVDVIDVQSVAAQWGATCQAASPPDMIARVTWVIDGDTVILEGGERLRYLGIDTPELGDLPECYGQEALWANIDLTKNQTLSLYFDTEQRDRYDRLLAYPYLPDGTFVSGWLARNGYARTFIISPNTRLARTILNAEDEARAAGRGLWEACR